MKVGLSSLFLFGAPFLALRVSDGFSFGLLDILAIPMMLLVAARFKKTFRTQFGLAVAPVIFFVFASFFVNAIFVAFEPRDLAFFRMVFIFLPALLVVSYKLDEEELYRYSRLFFWGGLVAIAIGIFLYLIGFQVRTDQQALWAGDGTGPKLRAGGILGNSSDFGHFASVWGSVCGLSALLMAKRNRFLICGIIFILALYATWISSSRAALLHLLIAYGIAAPFLLRKDGWVGMWVSICMVGVLLPFILSDFSLVLPASVSHNLQRLDFLNLSGESQFFQTSRFLNWATLFGIFNDNWLLGIGYKNINGIYGIWGDNAFLTVFVEFGIFAGFSYVFLWVWLLVRAFSKAMHSRLGKVLFALCISEIFHALTVDTVTIWYSMPFALLFIGVYLKAAPSGGRLREFDERRGLSALG